MICSFLNRKNSGRLLVFFNGWGMEDSLFRDWKAPSFDVMSVHDYTTVEPLADLARYDEIHVAAWSLGVRAAADSLALSRLNVKSAVAINGTLPMISSENGITPEVFHKTIENWGDEKARLRFRRRMAGSIAAAESLPLAERTPEAQKAELESLERNLSAGGLPENPFRRAVIGGMDRIVPPESQKNFWSSAGAGCIFEPDMPHYPFLRFSSWEEVMEIAGD